jgi:hypothetical protein
MCLLLFWILSLLISCAHKTNRATLDINRADGYGDGHSSLIVVATMASQGAMLDMASDVMVVVMAMAVVARLNPASARAAETNPRIWPPPRNPPAIQTRSTRRLVPILPAKEELGRKHLLLTILDYDDQVVESLDFCLASQAAVRGAEKESRARENDSRCMRLSKWPNRCQSG